MPVRVLFCPSCNEPTTHAHRPARALLAIAGLLALAAASLLWTAFIDRVTGLLALLVSAVLLGRGVASRFRFVACTVCNERRDERPRRADLDP